MANEYDALLEAPPASEYDSLLETAVPEPAGTLERARALGSSPYSDDMSPVNPEVAEMTRGQEPLLKLGRFPEQADPLNQVSAGIINAGAGLAESLTTPTNMALLPAAAAPGLGRIVSALFAGEMLRHVPEQVQAAEADPTLQGKVEKGLGVVTSLLFTAGAAKHAVGKSPLLAAADKIYGTEPAIETPAEPAIPATQSAASEVLPPEPVKVAELPVEAVMEPARDPQLVESVPTPEAKLDEAPNTRGTGTGEVAAVTTENLPTGEGQVALGEAAVTSDVTRPVDTIAPETASVETAGKVNEQTSIPQNEVAGQTEIQAQGVEANPSAQVEAGTPAAEPIGITETLAELNRRNAPEPNEWATATLPRLEAEPVKAAPVPEPVGIVPPGVVGLHKASTAANAALKKVAASIKGVAPFTDFRKSVLDWSATNQKSTGEVMKAAADLTKSVPDVTRREGITNWIQAGGDVAELQARAAATTNLKLKKGYEAALALTPEEQALAGKVRQTYDTLLQRAKAHGIEINEIENYVNQIWKRQPLRDFTASSNRKLSTSIRFAKERYYDSFFHGEQSGLKPETKDIAKLLPIYINEVNNAISAKQFVAELSKGKASDGRPLLAPRGSGKVIEGEGGGVQLVFPESATKDTLDYKPLEQPALHNWKWVGTDAETGQTTLVKSDLAVHPEAYSHLKNVLGQSAIREWYRSPSENPLGAIPKATVKFLVDDLQRVGKATMLGMLSPFHMVQEGTHAIGHRVNPFGGIPKINLSDAAQIDAAQHGLMLLPDRVSAQQFREGLDGSKSNILANAIGKLGGKPGKIVKGWIDGFQDYLFHEYIPGLKLKTYDHILPRNMDRFTQELASGEVSESQIKYLSAQQANAAYGHLQYADMGRNPTMQHLLQAFLLAPDFLEARGRFAAQALKPSKAGREQLAALATLAATQFVVSRILNKTLDDDYHWDHPFEVIQGNRKYVMRSVPEDIYNATQNTRQFISGRLSPFIGRGLLEGLSGVNYRREPTEIGETLVNLVAGMIPLTIQPATRGLSETGRDNPVSPIEQFLGSIGLHVSRFSPVSKVYELSKEWTDKHAKEYGLDKRRAVFPVSKYQQLRYALEDNNTEKVKAERARLMAEEKIDSQKLEERLKDSLNHPFTGTKKTDEVFKLSLDKEDKKLFDAAIKRRELLLKRYQGIR